MSEVAHASPKSIDIAALTPANAHSARAHSAPIRGANPCANNMPELNEGDRVCGGRADANGDHLMEVR